MKHNKSNLKLYAIIGTMIIVIVIAIIILSFLLKSKTTTNKENITSIKNDFLRCEATDIDYPIFTYYNSNGKTLKIDLIFNDDKLKTIALEYTLDYSDRSIVATSEAHNRAAMNISFGKNNLDTDEFNAKYTKLDNALRMNLYANDSDIDYITTPYFMINADGSELPKTLIEYQLNYEQQGLSCTISN